MTMKKFYFFYIFLILSTSLFAAKVTVINSGFSFSPSTVTVNVGDTVIFQLASAHNVVEVSQSTYNANGNTSNGGFTLPFGGGSLKMTKAGTFYYVCEPHASMGMKGMIIVNSTSGTPELTGSFDFQVYPNPARDHIYASFHLNTRNTVEYTIFDDQGKAIYSKKVEYGTGGDIAELIQPNAVLPAGIYFLEVKTKEGLKSSQRILIY
jgi:plastocyanin